MSTLELFIIHLFVVRSQDRRKAIKRAIKRKGYARKIYWVKMTADEIRSKLDHTYAGNEPRDILTVEYKTLLLCPARLLNWEHMTPSELARRLERREYV